MNQLWLDAGNTRLKWQLWEKGELHSSGAFVHQGNVVAVLEKLLDELCEKRAEPIEYIAISSVLGSAVGEEMEKLVANKTGLELASAKVEKKLLGFECAYEDESRLGVDRWLSCLWAFKHYGAPVLLVSGGSALTIDAIDGAGQHLGGYILPGISMARNALLGETQSVRFEFKPDELDSLHYGRDTAGAVNNGILLQTKSFIEHVWREFSEKFSVDNPKLILTGGDAQLLAKIIDIEFDFQEDIVVKGLRLVMLNKNKDLQV